MEQHPVPRNVTGFKFQLIGSMTLKQFLYVVFGLAIGFLIYKLPLSMLRFPLAGAAVFIGVAFAFIPIQERPLEEWLRNLIASIYSPTQFVWKKQGVAPLYLANTPVSRHIEKASIQQTPESARQDARQKLDEYMKRAGSNRSSIDAQEAASLAKVSLMLEGGRTVHPPIKQSKSPLQKPSMVSGQPKTDEMSTTTSHITPGVVAGMIRSGSAPLKNQIVHVYDERGNAVRLLKTDSSGKFMTNLALSAGSYRLEVEDPEKRHAFDPFRFTVSNAPLKPWLIVPKTEKH